MARRAPRVVVIGGGPAGATAALMLARLGLECTVLEARRGPFVKVGECLPPNVNPLLERLGLAETLRRDGHLAARGNRFSWGSPEPFERDFLFGPGGAGWHLDRRLFEESLAAAAVREGAHWRYGHRLLGCARRENGWTLAAHTPRGPETIEADFVLDASGRAARFARAAGARPMLYDRLVGAAVYMTPTAAGGAAADPFTLIEAVAGGWWYSAHLPGGKLVVVHMTDDDLAPHAALRSLGGWLALLSATEHTRRRVAEGGFRPLAAPRVLRAHSARLTAVGGWRWLAAGDAAATYDPLSSYGIGSAMGAGFYAAAAVAELFEGGRDALHTYEFMLDRAYAQYLLLRREQYLEERRWPEEPFWRRRHAHAPESSTDGR